MAVPALLAKVVECLRNTARKITENNDRATFTNGQATLTSEDWQVREITDNAGQDEMRLGPRAFELLSTTCWTGTASGTAAIPELHPDLGASAPALCSISRPSVLFQLGVPAAQLLGALAVRKTA